MINMPADAVRQAAFDDLFDEYHERYASRFYLGWHFGTEQALISRFWRELAPKVAGCTIDELGAALSPHEPLGWKEREQLAWIFLLGTDASFPLEASDRGRLLAIACLSGKLDQVRHW